MRKRLLSLVLAVTMALGLGVSASAANAAPKVYVDGTEFSYDTAEYGVATNLDGHIYLPLRAIAEKLGYKVGWEENRYATVEGPKGKVIVDLGNLESKSLTVGGETVTLDYKIAMAVNGRSLVAIRAFSNALDCDVAWENDAAWINKIAPGKAGSVENENMADTGSDGNTSVDTVLTEYDPASLEQTNAIGPKLAESFGKSALGFPGATYDIDDLGNNMFLTDVPGQRGLTLKMHVDTNGTIVISDSDFSNTKQGQAFMSMVDAFLGDTTNPRIKTPVMAMFNKLVTKLSIGVNDSGHYSDANEKWCDENLHNKAYNLTDDYVIYFSGQGSMYSINIAPKDKLNAATPGTFPLK